ncbi:hypothetical protein OUO20_16430 [Arthrobacter sp. FX8]|uniref:hypothetical protein n=1 Tax=Arthrobacter sp. FX8 TaxID=2997335 RepID=UPI00227ACABD|nr:hypothetical protein [Arthrobacter sp. FX8]WAJ32674.1 hypothetical protein OUO20_16430 [Arthrobacter sp. FX8]
MENPDTLVLNLTFLGTVGVALLMFLVLFLLGVITLVLAGLCRFAALVLMALFGRVPGRRDSPGTAGAPVNPDQARRPLRARASALKPDRPKKSLRTAVERHPKLAAARHEPPVLAEDWASAVAEADKRAQARARAAAPEIKLSVRDLPDPAVPADKVSEVAPLVESALHNHRPPHELPRSFKKPQPPHPVPPLDTGSLVSIAGPQQVLKEKAQDPRPKP